MPLESVAHAHPSGQSACAEHRFVQRPPGKSPLVMHVPVPHWDAAEQRAPRFVDAGSSEEPHATAATRAPTDTKAPNQRAITNLLERTPSLRVAPAHERHDAGLWNRPFREQELRRRRQAAPLS
jgi:hypothetical protein